MSALQLHNYSDQPLLFSLLLFHTFQSTRFKKGNALFSKPVDEILRGRF